MAYQDVILAEASLAAYWRLGETSGTSAADSKGTNTGTYTGTYTLGAAGVIRGDPNKALTVSGAGYVSVPAAAALNLGDVFSLEAWVRHPNPTGFNGLVQSIVDKGALAYFMRLQGTATGAQLQLRINSNATVAFASKEITDTAGHHVVATKNGATVKLYLDGVDVTGTTAAATAVNSTFALAIGTDDLGNGGPTDFLNATVDEVAVYNTALGSAAVVSHFNVGRAQSALPLVGVG